MLDNTINAIIIINSIENAKMLKGDVIMKEQLYDIGNTDAVGLYDFAVLLGAAYGVLIDRDSELFQAFMKVFNSAWGQLPELVTIDFRESADE